MLLEPTNLDELREATLSCAHVIPTGAGTKPALSDVDDRWQRISTTRLAGIVEYEPCEFTITALAGTPLSEIENALEENGQYLPFDPPLAAAGATIGGTVAAGLSGPGAFRFGPIRDFLIGIRFIDGKGRLITGGGKVVKNAAGFDLPKFLIGSCGRLGILAELTFKVFPKPPASVTFGIAPRDLLDAIDLLKNLSGSAFELDALEYETSAKVIWGRLRGNRSALISRLEQIDQIVRKNHHPLTICEPRDADFFWDRRLAFEWSAPENALAKIPLTPQKIQKLHFARLSDLEYGMGGNVAWVSDTPKAIEKLWSDDWSGIALRGLKNGSAIPGNLGANEISSGLKNALDPENKFPPLFPAE